MKRTNIYLTEPSVERLQALSEEKGISIAEIVRRAVDEYLTKQEQEKSLTSSPPTPPRAG